MPKYKKVKRRTGNGYELLLWDDGDKSYYFNGGYHKEDGPAYISLSGNKRWYLNNQPLTKQWFKENPEKINEMQAWEFFEPEELVRLKDYL